jgi:hypothetical protein
MPCDAASRYPLIAIFFAGGKPEYQQSQRQNQDCSCQYQKIDPGSMLRADNLDDDSAQSRDGDIDQIANRELCRFEIDADHRADFEIDEQE